MRTALLLVVIAACWRGSEPATEEPALVQPRQRGATCEQVAANTRTVLAAGKDAELAARADGFGGIVLRRCTADEWSIELRRCVAGAKTVDDTDACRELATEPQRDAFERDLEVFAVQDGQ
jgi:hypothetical protein